ncbi:pseudouridine synthase [Corynebacterium sp. p3-SID1194]|nr:pseudouridine synthase [Corynebacterium sp. p3-SID1194]
MTDRSKSIHRSRRKRRPPLPPRGGLGATRARVPEGEPIRAWDLIWHLISTQRHRHPEDNESAVSERFARGEVVLIDASPVAPDALLTPGTDVFFYRRPAPEARVPYEIDTVFEDDNILVVNKPPFLATMPRGSHITESVTVRLRRATGNQELTPAHRLDRATSGLILLTKRAELRGAYQELFTRREVDKIYEAIADDIGLNAPLKWEHHIEKTEGEPAARILSERKPNALTYVSDIQPLTDRPGAGRYLLHPVTGRTHQLRVQMLAAGIPIHGDPIYPRIHALDEEDFATPMLLSSVGLSFTDPLSGQKRRFTTPGFSGFPIPQP